MLSHFGGFIGLRTNNSDSKKVLLMCKEDEIGRIYQYGRLMIKVSTIFNDNRLRTAQNSVKK